MKILAAVILAALVAGCAHVLTCETNTPPTAKIRVKPAGSFIK